MLRPYQVKALEEIRALYREKKKKVLLHAPVGSGKTTVFCEILKNAYHKKKYSIMVVRGRKLVYQASERLARENVPHSIMMAGNKYYNADEYIQVCSVDTMLRREFDFEKIAMVIVDECHLAGGVAYKRLIEKCSNAYILGVTATPYQKEDITHIAEHVVKPITIKELVAQGFLVAPTYYAPTLLDLDDVDLHMGEYDVEQILEKCSVVVGDIPGNWKKYGEGRPTICFAINIMHSHAIVRELKAAGIRAVHIDADSTEDERQHAIEQIERGFIDVISNVGIFTTGVDIPCISCIIMARPTKSLILYLQSTGRGTRPHPGKDDFIILDHANNVMRHGFIDTEHEAVLYKFNDKKKKVSGEEAPKIKTCVKCYNIYEAHLFECPKCGHKNEIKQREIETLVGSLKKIEPTNNIADRFKELQRIQNERGYKRGWLYFTMAKEFGEAIAEIYVPKRKVPDWIIHRL